MLLRLGADVLRGLSAALDAPDDAARLDAARTALLDAIAQVEGALAREKFPGLREP